MLQQQNNSCQGSTAHSLTKSQLLPGVLLAYGIVVDFTSRKITW